MNGNCHNSHEIRTIIDKKCIQTYYQPIVKLDHAEIIGYEALSRGPVNSFLHSPIELLAVAEKHNALWELEMLFRSLAIERCTGLQDDQYLFINVDPNIIRDPNFKKGMTKEYLDKVGFSPDKIIFEITERTAIDDYDAFRDILSYYTSQGYKIAIDDAGAGYSGMNTIVETKPHFIKIDMNIIRNIHQDSFKQAIVKSFVQLGNNTNIRIIAEGIESKEELKTLIVLGVYAGQGFFFQEPCETLMPLNKETSDYILRLNQQVQNNQNYSSNYHFIGPIAEPYESISASAKGKDLITWFSDEKHEGVCVTRSGFVEGLITKQSFFQTLATQYGHALYLGRPVSLLMDKTPLVVDYYTSISKVAELAMNRDRTHIYDTIVVTQGTKYYGLVTVKDLLQYAIQMERDFAREVNPLTGLPGNTIINRVLNDIISYDNNCLVLYFDLDNFKAYNDVYGFDNGDKIIVTTAQIIQETIKKRDAINSFVGHIGGDDFVAVLETSDLIKIQKLIDDLISEFDQAIIKFYTDNDRIRGYIISEDRAGQTKHFSLTALSIAGAYGHMDSMKNSENLSQFMASIKKRVKKIPGSACQILSVEDPEISIIKIGFEDILHNSSTYTKNA